jgi:subtilase family serine protease
VLFVVLHVGCFSEAGGPNLVDGTSCSAPVWGGIMGLLNSYLKTSGKPVRYVALSFALLVACALGVILVPPRGECLQLLGFANPTLYQIYAANPNAFIDITEGSNTCTEDTCSCSPGFTAAPGWGTCLGCVVV